ncbi:MAG: tetratricopeptide repeat protein [Anaerolineae bacterium]
MDAAIELDSTNPELYVLRGNITLLIYEWDRVLADYNAAIELSPDYADAYFYRGILFYTRAEYQPALDDFARYLELAPDGEHAADAATYIEEIERTQAALDG